MRVAFATFVVAVAICSRVEAERDVEIGKHEQNISAFSEKLRKDSGTFMVHTHAIAQRHKACGSAQEPGDDLPDGICSGEVQNSYTKKTELTDVEGTFGKIWTASDIGGTNEDKIIKIVKYEKGNNDPKMLDPIELFPLRLNLPFVSRVESVFQGSDDVSIVQPFYSGGDLFPYQARNEDDVLRIAKQYAYGLWQIQRSGLIYGDVKTENTFWVDNTRQRLVLADFGLVRSCGNAGEVCENDGVRGTYQYLSPSILQGKPYGFEVDWWAFGGMLQNLVWRNCYWRSNDEKTIEAIINDNCLAILDDERNPIKQFPNLKKFVKKLSTKTEFGRLETKPARAKMQSADPAIHPVLSDEYFFNEAERAAGWLKVCTDHYGPDECTRPPSLGSLCKEGEQKAGPNSQQQLLDRLNSARDMLLGS